MSRGSKRPSPRSSKTTWRLPLSMTALAGTAMTFRSAPVAISTSPYMSGSSARSGFGSSTRTFTVRVSFIEMRIDHRYGAAERSAGMSPRRDHDLLACLDGGDVAFGHIRHHPNLRVIGDPEPDVAGLEALTVAPIAFEDHAIDRRAIFECVRHAPLALHLLHERLGYAEVLQAARRTDGYAGCAFETRRRERFAVARPIGVLFDQEACSFIEHVLPKDFCENVALLDVGTGGDRPNRFDIAIEARRDDDDAPLIELNDTRSLDRAGDGVLADRDGLDAGALDLARRNFDGTAVASHPRRPGCNPSPSRLFSASETYPADPWDCGRT